jgi:lipoprotein NlpD
MTRYARFEFTTTVAFALITAGCSTNEISPPVPVVDRSPPLAAAAKQPATKPAPVQADRVHFVGRGETLYSIALERGIDYRDLAQWNNLEDPAKIRVGQSLRLSPPGERVATPASPASEIQVGAAPGAGRVESRMLESGVASPPAPTIDSNARTSPKALRLPYSKENLAMLSKGESQPSAKPAAIARPESRPDAQPADDPDAIEFIWPARGRLLAGFAEPNSRGIDIGGRMGDPVVAAAPGRVMYTGTGIRGYGKLIVIRHDNGFNSVYAHNRDILVREGQTVARGQKIAELGDTDADKPKLHFEIRKSGKPVDPLKYLPGDNPS